VSPQKSVDKFGENNTLTYMKRIYVVKTGYWQSELQIVGAFSTRKMATDWIRSNGYTLKKYPANSKQGEYAKFDGQWYYIAIIEILTLDNPRAKEIIEQ
jgi:hypothetical protein